MRSWFGWSLKLGCQYMCSSSSKRMVYIFVPSPLQMVLRAVVCMLGSCQQCLVLVALQSSPATGAGFRGQNVVRLSWSDHLELAMSCSCWRASCFPDAWKVWAEQADIFPLTHHAARGFPIAGAEMAAGTRGAVSLFPYGFCVISLAFETKAFPGALCVPLVLKLKAAPGARSFGSSPGAPQMAWKLGFGAEFWGYMLQCGKEHVQKLGLACITAAVALVLSVSSLHCCDVRY